jgi:hypothetical protein
MKVLLGFVAVSAVVLGASLFAVNASSDVEVKERLAAAASVTEPWDRYVALNHDWSPGAWCRVVRDESEAHRRWAQEAAVALDAALLANDARAIAYLYSPEGAWYCLDEQRDRHPQDPQLREALMVRLQRLWPSSRTGERTDRMLLLKTATRCHLQALAEPVEQGSVVQCLRAGAALLDGSTGGDHSRRLESLLEAAPLSPAVAAAGLGQPGADAP